MADVDANRGGFMEVYQLGQGNLETAGFWRRRLGGACRRRRGLILLAADDLEEFFRRCGVAESSHVKTSV